MCHLQSYSVYNNQPATWVHPNNFLFQNKTHVFIREFSHEMSKLFPNNPEVSTAASSKRSSEVAEVAEICLGSWNFAARGWRSLGLQYVGSLRNSKFKIPPKVEFEVWGFWVKTFWGCLIMFDVFGNVWKCFDDGLRCLNMVDDA